MTTSRRLHGSIFFLLLGAAACAVPACSAGEDETDTSHAAQTESEKGTGSVSHAEDDVDNDPIVDDPTNPLLTDLEPITAAPDADHTQDTAASPHAALATKPAEYLAARAAAGVKPPRKFAGATVLAALKRLRRYLHSQPYRVTEDSTIEVTAPHARGISMADYDKLTKSGSNGLDLTTPFDDFKYAWNTTGDGSDGNNMSVMPPNWSELQVHFYPMPPHRRHGCWTTALRGAYSSCADVFTAGTPEKDFRGTINAICHGEKTLRSDIFKDPASAGRCSAWKLALSVVPIELSAYNLLWVDPVARKFVPVPDDVRNALDLTSVDDPDVIPALKSVQFAQAQRERSFVNVWDYIMLSSTHAFDWEQQQAVLNAYYGANKEYAVKAGVEGVKGPFDPNDAADCNMYRAKRPGDPRDGSHCRADKIMEVQLLSNGR